MKPSRHHARRVKPLSAALVVVLLAGCASPAPEPERPAIDWQGFELQTTPTEPFEQAGTNKLGYTDDLFGLYAEREEGMPRYAIVAPDAVYTSETLMGWIVHEGLDDVPGSRAWRLEAWDIRLLVDRATYDGEAFEGDLEVRGQTRDYRITLDPWRVEGDLEPETPYSLIPGPVDLPFNLEVPTAKTLDEVQGPNRESRDNHVKVIGWLDDYADANQGRVPDEVTADSLFLQRLGQAWPVNPFDGEPLVDVHASGHFRWEKCSDQDAIYLGYAWDGSPIGTAFGQGCAL